MKATDYSLPGVMMAYQKPDFLQQYRGSFTSALRWPQLDALWGLIRAEPQGWYVYALGEPPPVQVSDEAILKHFIDEIDALLRREHQEDYCGIVYADDMSQPNMVKIYDPHHLGVVCGYSDNPPLPGWVLSRIQPVDLPNAQASTRARRHWWQKIFG